MGRMREDLMKLEQCNFRISRHDKRTLKLIADDKGITFEGLLQEMADRVIDEHLDELEEETKFRQEQIEFRRSQAKYRERSSGGQR